MKVVWTMRALRFLTGTNFLAETKHVFGSDEVEQRRQTLLHKYDEKKVPFFAVWMSRDSIYFAPEDAQTTIIAQWKLWIEKNKYDLPPIKETRTEEWYF